MGLDLASVGYKSEPFAYEYDFHQTVLYALGVGAKRAELDYLYEGRGPQVLPSFAVVPAYAAVAHLMEHTRCDMLKLLHGAQTVRLHRPLPARARLETVGEVTGIYDFKKLAQLVLTTRTSERGEPLCETEWTMYIRGEGGFGGPRPPKVSLPRAQSDQAPGFVTSLGTSPEQALLYRLSGDLNPLHADPEFAERAGFAAGPILHGLCTFGIMTRALVQHLNGDARRVRAVGGQFRNPVWPGETVRTEGYPVGTGQFALEAYAEDRPEAVITNAWAEITQ